MNICPECGTPNLQMIGRYYYCSRCQWDNPFTNSEIRSIANTAIIGIKKIVKQLEKTYERDKRIAISFGLDVRESQ